jgi:hypothetical protein
MGKRIFFDVPKDSNIFRDSKNSSNFYMVTPEEWVKKTIIVNQYGIYETDVPSEHTIKVCPVRRVDQIDNLTDKYAPVTNELIDFPINQIEGIVIGWGKSTSL